MNWGNKILVTYIVFATGISYLAYRSMNTNFELVEKDYYKSELQYQQVIDGTNRANALHTTVILKQENNMIWLQLPDEMKGKNISGTVLFYCAYGEMKDREFVLVPAKEGTPFFSFTNISSGNYTVKINWKSEGKDYHTEKELSVL